MFLLVRCHVQQTHPSNDEYWTCSRPGTHPSCSNKPLESCGTLHLQLSAESCRCRYVLRPSNAIDSVNLNPTHLLAHPCPQSRCSVCKDLPRLARMQAFRDELVEAALAGERALFYAFGFSLDSFAVQHMIDGLMVAPRVLAAFGTTDVGKRCIRVAWELVEHGCVATPLALHVCCACVKCVCSWRISVHAIRTSAQVVQQSISRPVCRGHGQAARGHCLQARTCCWAGHTSCTFSGRIHRCDMVCGTRRLASRILRAHSNYHCLSGLFAGEESL
jgi:hypothetical protein